MSEKRYLISVGINDYEINPLDYCVKDSEDICKSMELYCNVEDENSYNIFSSLEKPNTDIFGGVEKSIERIKSKFIGGSDSIFFYFSGHGAQSGNSTALVFHQKVVQLQSLFDLFLELKPKFVFCLVDSCYSGVGIEDGIAKSANELVFSQHLKLASGYNIICASAEDSPAKEDSDLRNGRLTRMFIDVLKNKLNYKDGILSLSKVFQLIDDAFKNNPTFRQFPFAQTKGLSTYPLAFQDEQKAEIYYATHYVDDIENYDWDVFKDDLKRYCSIRNDIANEFTRLIRELLRNSIKWSRASFLKVEVAKNIVNVIDNSGRHFDIFNPPAETILHGGGRTARIFLQSFSEEFKYEFVSNEEETCQIFTFHSLVKEEPCVLKPKEIGYLWEFQKGKTIEIPEKCNDYLIYVPHGFLDLSTINVFLIAAIESSLKSNKAITIIIDDNDRLKTEFINSLKYYRHLGEHKVVIK